MIRSANLLIACTLVATFGARGAEAALIGPDAFGYSADNVTFAFEDISATGTRALAGTDFGDVTPSIPFAFSFYGTDYGSVTLNTNGLMTFGASYSPGDFNEDLTVSSFGVVDVPAIAVLWDDWQFFATDTDGVYFETRGAVGNRRFVAQWNQHQSTGGSPTTVTFQAVLFEGTNDVRLNYLDVDSGDARASGLSSTVGIRDTNGQVNGENLQWSLNSAVISNEESILFSTTAFSAVPEPSSMTLLGIGGLLVCGFAARHRRRIDDHASERRGGF